jgi:hypothetical protein
VNQQVSSFFEGRVLSEIIDVVAPVFKDTLFTIDESSFTPVEVNARQSSMNCDVVWCHVGLLIHSLRPRRRYALKFLLDELLGMYELSDTFEKARRMQFKRFEATPQAIDRQIDGLLLFMSFL